MNKDEFLEHYGVIGMRWGISRAGNVGALKKVASKILAKTEKVERKLSKAQIRKIKIDKASDTLKKGFGLKKIGLLAKLPGSKAHLARSKKRIELMKRISVRNTKKISKYKKQLIEQNLVSKVLNKKMSQLSPASIQRGKAMVGGATQKEVKK